MTRDVCGHAVAAGLLAVRLKSVVMVDLRLGAELDTAVRADALRPGR